MTGGTDTRRATNGDGAGDTGDGGSRALPAFESAESVKRWLSERFARLTDPEKILRAAAGAVGTQLGAARVGYGELSADGTRLTVPLDWTRPGTASAAGVHAIDSESELARRCREGRTVVVEHTADRASPWPVDPLVGGASRAFIIVPLLHDGRLVAVFTAADDRPREWSPEEVTLTSQTGARIWSALQHLRLTEQLRESEEQFRMMAENLPGICWVGDRDAHPLWGNSRWHAMYDDTAAAHGDARGAIHPDDLDRARAIWREMRAAGTPGEFQLRLRGRDGIFRPFLSKASPIRDAGGEVTRWVGVQIDLSDQAAQDRRQAVLRSFADRAREMSDPIAIMTLLAGMLAEHVGVEQFIFVEAADGELGEGAMFRAIDGVRRTEPEPTLAGAFDAFAAMPQPAKTFVARCNEDMPADSPIRISAAAMGMQSGINVPLVRGGRQVAGFSCLNRQPRDWSVEDIALCEELAERLWAAVSRARAETALKDRERAQAFLIDWTDRLRGLGDVDTIVAVTLVALGEFLGASRATYSVSDPDGRVFEVRGEWRDGVASIAHTRFSLDWAADDQRAAWLGGEPLRFDDVAVDPRIAGAMRRFYDGAAIQAFLTIPLIEDGKARCALSVQQDRPRHWREDEVALLRDVAERTWLALERARAETALQQRERAQGFLIEWTDRTRDLTRVDAIIAETTAMLAAYLGVTRATYSVGDEAGRRFTICGEWRDPRVLSIADTSFSLDDVGATVEREWLAGALVRYDDIANDRRIEDAVRAAYHDTQIAAFVSVPLIESGRVRSALSVQHHAARVWRPDELQLLREVANRTWVAIERARAEAELQERERNQAFLIDWTDRLRGLTKADDITGVTLDALGRFLGVARTTYAIGDSDGVTFTIRDEWRDHGPSIAGETFTFAQAGPAISDQWHRGESISSADVESDPAVSPAMLGPYRDTGIRAFVSVPMLESGRIRSSLSVQHDMPRSWSERELNLLREVAERTWTALERARAETELQERERNQAFLIDWTDRLRGERDPDRIVAITLERLGVHCGVSRATYSLGDETGDLLINRGEWADGVVSVADTVWSLANVDPEVRRQWLSGATVHYDDIPNDARITPTRRAFFEGVSVRSLVTIPLIEDGRVRSALSLQSKTARRWTEEEIQLLRDVAERTWVVLERARAEAELATRERNQAFLIDWSDRIREETSPAAMMAITLEAVGRFLSVSRATFAQLDGAMFEVVGEWREAVSSLLGNRFSLPSVGEVVDRDWHAGESVRFDDVATDPRLEPAAVDRYRANQIAAFLSVPLIAGGAMQSALSVQSETPRAWTDAETQLLRDIAERTWVALERAEAQAALAERGRHQAFLVAWNDMVRGEAKARVILNRTVQMLGTHLAVSRANYAEPFGGDGTLVVLEEYVDGVDSVVGARFTLDALGPAIAGDHLSGRPLIVPDTAADPRFDAAVKPMYDAIGVRAVVTIPMLRGDEIMAVLSVQQDAPRAWTDGEIALVHELADRTLAVLERAQSEARLAESEAQLAAFMENAPVAMNLSDASGRYIRVNPECGLAVGRPVEELTGLTPHDVFPPQIADQLEVLHQRALAGEVVSAEMSIGGDRKYNSALTIIFPIGDGQGAAKTAGFTIDLSERKRAEAALQKSRDTLYQTEKLTALGSLLAGVSHELNNPLSIVVAQAVMMERQSQGSELAERAQKIRKAADRCARIVQSFLAMARQKRPEREAVDLNAIAVAAHELADYGLRNDGIRTLRELAPGLPPISADSDQLHQIVINLIVNAQQAMVEGGAGERVLTLRSGPGEAPGTVMLEIADTGPGIPLEVQRRIFEPFYTTKPQGQGTGVGLSFSQGLAEAHGGTLELVPVKAGACFRLTLPIDADHVAAVAAPELLRSHPAPARRALVVDDEREIAESLADFLSLEGFTCEIAAGGIAAQQRLGAADSGEFDLIISDLRMPDLDGPRLHAWVAEHRPELSARMAFATGDTLGQTAARFLAEFQRPVLEKPFTPEAVRRFLEQMDLA